MIKWLSFWNIGAPWRIPRLQVLQKYIQVLLFFWMSKREKPNIRLVMSRHVL